MTEFNSQWCTKHSLMWLCCCNTSVWFPAGSYWSLKALRKKCLQDKSKCGSRFNLRSDLVLVTSARVSSNSRCPPWSRCSSQTEVNSCFGGATRVEMLIDAANMHMGSVCLMMFRLPSHHSLSIIWHHLWRSEEENMKAPQEAAGGWGQPGSEWLSKASRSSCSNYYQEADFNLTNWTFKSPFKCCRVSVSNEQLWHSSGVLATELY